LKIDPENIDNEMINNLKKLIHEHKGETELKFLFLDPDDKISLPMFSRTFRVRLNNELLSYLEDTPGIEFKVN
jgi:hypothetical protein